MREKSKIFGFKKREQGCVSLASIGKSYNIDGIFGVSELQYIVELSQN